MAAVAIENSTLITDANLQAYWKLENVNDSKSSYNLTNNGTVTFGAAKFNNGANMGDSDTGKYLSVGGAAMGLTWKTTRTFMGWIKLPAEISAGSVALYRKLSGTVDNDKGQEYMNYEYNGGTRRIFVSRYHAGGNPDNETKCYFNVSLGTSWHFIVYTYDGTNMTLYVDGSAGTSVADTTNGGTIYGTQDFSLGKDYVGSQIGIFDDWAVFNRVLTPTEISNHYSGADSTLSSGGLFFSQL